MHHNGPFTATNDENNISNTLTLQADPHTSPTEEKLASCSDIKHPPDLFHDTTSASKHSEIVFLSHIQPNCMAKTIQKPKKFNKYTPLSTFEVENYWNTPEFNPSTETSLPPMLYPSTLDQKLDEAQKNHKTTTNVENSTHIALAYPSTQPSQNQTYNSTLHHVTIHNGLEATDDSKNDQQEHISSLQCLSSRLCWLISLLILQSLVSLILKRFQNLIEHHPSVVFYLTMLVGTGGNAGSQSTVLVIRSLAVGKCKREHFKDIIYTQLHIGFILATVLALVTFLWLYLINGNLPDVTAVSLSLFAIVLLSVLIGTLCPLGFSLFNIDPAHAGAAVQVVMDLVGVSLTCLVSYVILDYMYLKRPPLLSTKIVP